MKNMREPGVKLKTRDERGLCRTVDGRRCDRSASGGNEAIFDCTGGNYGPCSGKATKS